MAWTKWQIYNGMAIFISRVVFMRDPANVNEKMYQVIYKINDMFTSSQLQATYIVWLIFVTCVRWNWHYINNKKITHIPFNTVIRV